VPLGQLTLLVGENSAGKSSVLQALRLLQQAVRTAGPGDAFALNGELIRMGTIDDLRSAQADAGDAVGIGVEVSSPDFARLPWLHRRIGLHRERSPGDAALTWNVQLAGTSPDEPGSTRIREVRLSAEDRSDERRLTLRLRRTAPAEAPCPVPAGPTWSDHVVGDRSLQGDLHSEDLSGAEPEKRLRIVAASLSGALPRGLLTEQPAGPTLAAFWVRRFVDYLQRPPWQGDPAEDAPALTAGEAPEEPVDDIDDAAEYAVGALAGLLEEFGDPSTVLSRRVLADRHFPQVSDYFAMLHGYFWSSEEPIEQEIEDHPPYEEEHPPYGTAGPAGWIIHPSSDDKVDWFVRLLTERIAESLDVDTCVPLLCEEREWRGLESFAEHVAGFVDRRIHYLGPLRAAPESVTSTSPVARTGDIGSSGEFTAAVLRSLGAKPVSVPMPDHRHETLPLSEAVEAWAAHLGLVDGVTIGDLAAIGLTVRVRPRGLEGDIPLPSVGVGVSQLMPVLVRCLLAEPGSLILLEQPELHLHPGLQQRLADFFVAIARSGRQLIVETHSEYFVSRIRRRIAAADGDEVRSLTRIIFAERDQETGVTDYRGIEVSPYGDIDDWPRGFFDQAAEEEREIIRAGLKKRADR
jgi:hypothetical protein